MGTTYIVLHMKSFLTIILFLLKMFHWCQWTHLEKFQHKELSLIWKITYSSNEEESNEADLCSNHDEMLNWFQLLMYNKGNFFAFYCISFNYYLAIFFFNDSLLKRSQQNDEYETIHKCTKIFISSWLKNYFKENLLLKFCVGKC